MGAKGSPISEIGLFSSAGHIASLFVAHGPDFSQKGQFQAKKFSSAGHF